MVQGPTIAVMIIVSCLSSCSGSKCVNEYVAPYKDLKTCWDRVAEIKRKDFYDANRYCRLDGVIQELDYDKH